MRKKICISALLCIVILIAFSMVCFALTDAEVESAVNSSSKESVSGSIFIWFLCAIAFMKVSQKIDSFMGSLGISVGRTGGSMAAEALLAARTIGTVVRGGGFAGFGKGAAAGGASGGTAQTGGGVFGIFGRKMAGGASQFATGSNSSGGIMESIGRKMYESSVGKGGSFATGVISTIARGEISKNGTISGPNGKTAMESYFGYNAKTSTDSKTTFENGGSTSISGGEGDTAAYSAAMGLSETPVFSEIEMGGGRITGLESSEEYPEGRAFAMYDTEKYARPEGEFQTVTAVDNSKWYKQYAEPALERTPYMNTSGEIKYNEKIAYKMPKAPMRKDKM
ncbi:MAG: hypothetical protein IJQ50_07250 [Clostridia bacterium]|nr:hypothetical protein [Clostridia bacterium]